MSSIFLCHSSADKEFVRLLKTRLERFDVQVWLDEDELRAGESLVDAISQAIHEMNYLGVVLSPSSIRSRWVKQELEMALTRQIETAKVKVIPLLLQRCEIPGFLSGKKYVSFLDWRKGNKGKVSYEGLDRSVQELVRAVGVDPQDSDRWSGQRMILVGDLRARLTEFFRPRKVVVEFLDDNSGLDFIRVDNGDRTFQLYEYWSRPSYLDLLNQVFTTPGDPPIVDIEFVETIAWTNEEREAALREICERHNVPLETFFQQHTSPAWEEYERWLFENGPISLIRVGDFKGRVKGG
jgi:hypothetical protein